MKRKLLLSSAAISAMLATGAMAQVVNFHDAANDQLEFNNGGNFYYELYAGQGAYADPGNDIWNSFGFYSGYGSTYFYSGGVGTSGLFPQQSGNPGNPYACYNAGGGWKTSTGTNLYAFTGGSLTDCGNSTSAAQWTPITLSVSNYTADNGMASYGYYHIPNGGPAFLLGEAAYDTGKNPNETFVLKNVPAGTNKYGLYLYGADYLNDAGTLFRVNSGNAHNGITATLNNEVGTPASLFVEGKNFVIFENVTPDASGNITISASPNPQNGIGNTNVPGETFVNGFQLIFNPPPTAVVPTAAQNVLAGSTANFSFATAFATSPSFRWQSVIGGVTNNLSDGGNIAGSGTTNLTIANVSAANVGLYQCVITTGTATNTSPAAPLTIISYPDNNSLEAGDLTTVVSDVMQTGDTIYDLSTNTVAPYNSIPPPFVMTVIEVEDGTLYQWENFGANGSFAAFVGPVGFVVTPKVGPTILKGLRLFTSSSHVEDDPADYLLEGSDDGSNFTSIAGGLLGLPPQRNAASGFINVTNQVLKEIDFANTTAYATYRLTFTNVNNNTIASNGVQIAEAQLLGAFPAIKPGIAQQPASNGVLLAGQTLHASVAASGPGPLSYQWYFNTSHLVANATNAILTLPDVQTTNDGSYNCVISNPYGSTNSTALSLTVITPTVYEATVLADGALAYYPLSEASGATAFEYVEGNNGMYDTNSVLGQPGVSDPPYLGFPSNDLAVDISGTLAGSWVSAPFGTLAGTNSLTIPNVTFTCWIYPVGVQNTAAGLIVDRSGVQCGFDIGASTAASQMLGYIWNNNTGPTYNYVSHLTPPQNQWSLAALSIAPDRAVFYLMNANGRLTATNAIAHSQGLLGGQWRIGNDADGDPTRSFNGMMNAVAVFPSTLSAAQMNALYDLGAFGTTNVAPSVNVPSVPVAVDENGNGSIVASVADGPPPFTYQWYYVASGVTNKITGAISNTLSLTDIQTAQGSYSYFVVVSNAYGATASSFVTLQILTGTPVFVTDLTPPLTVVPAGVPIDFAVTVTGTEPFTYQWMQDSAVVPAVTGSNYAFNALAGSNAYSVTISNADGSIVSATGVVLGLTNPPPVIGLNGNGTDWTLNEGSVTMPTITNDVLTLTAGVTSEATSAFYNTPQYIGGFIASFIYTAGGARGADGITFCMENDPLGTNAVGGGGGALGYYGITNSAAFEMNLYTGSPGGTGIQFGAEGSAPPTANPTAPYSSAAPVYLGSGDPIYVQLYYSQGVLNVWLVDATAESVFITNYDCDLPALVAGPSAYVGFTGGDGSVSSIQTVSNFVFSYTTPPILSLARGTAGSVIVSWPISVASQFMLQESTTLSGPWSNVASQVVDGENQATVTPGTKDIFFRLSLQ